MKSSRVVFFGNERLVSGLTHTDTPLLRGLIAEGYQVVAVVASHSIGTSRKNRTLEVADVAKEHAIPVYLPSTPMHIYEALKNLNADVAVLAAYGRIVPQAIIDLFPHGIINLHPSLLPKYRGSTPIESAILNGDSETGVSIMQLVSKMDAGPVFAQETIAIPYNATKFDLYDTLATTGTRLLLETLPGILDGSLQPTEQDDAEATYCELLQKSDGILDPQKLTAQEAERRVRAHINFPQSRLTTGNLEIIVTKAHVSEIPTSLSIQCKDDKHLAIDSLKPPGKKEMPVQAFLAGYKQKL